MLTEPVLRVRNLRTTFYTANRVVQAVDGINLSVNRGETVGIVGESGCGKSVTALSIMRLIPSPPGHVVAEEMKLLGVELQALTEKHLCQVRGNEMSMIFQDPMSALNPVLTVGEQIAESIGYHLKLDRQAARSKAAEALAMVQIPSPATRMNCYPHQLSGGMRQRVLMAMALACNPSLLIADEPTTALDVTTQAQILELLRQFQDRQGMGMIIITHDLAVVAETAHRVLVMYAGVVVENADVHTLFANPLHPYSQELLQTARSIHAGAERLTVIPGVVPTLTNLPGGCRFYPRCRHGKEICCHNEPPLLSCGAVEVRCWLYAEEVIR